MARSAAEDTIFPDASLSVLRARARVPANRRTIENNFFESLASAAA